MSAPNSMQISFPFSASETRFRAAMAPNHNHENPPRAFGAPGIEPRWTHSAKEGIGTAYHSSCHVWFTLSHGILNEIYYPTVDQPNTRDVQLLITDGESFCHEEKRDLRHEVDYPERNCLLYRLTNSDPAGRYRIVKHVLADPHRSVVLMHIRLEVAGENLRRKLKMYALLAPHLLRGGSDNSAWVCEFAGRRLFHVAREDVHLSFGCEPDFTRRSVGYAGASDGWRDLMDNLRMDWEFRAAERGNIALTAELDSSREEWTLGIALGRSAQSSATKLLQSLVDPFEQHRQGYVRQWRRTEIGEQYDISAHTGDEGGTYRLSRCVLLAHEDKLFQGAIIASLSIPWGEIKGDDEIGGYHLVWTRDLVQSATALLATGQSATPLRALIWLACIQKADGDFPQNSWIDGRAYRFFRAEDATAAIRPMVVNATFAKTYFTDGRPATGRRFTGLFPRWLGKEAVIEIVGVVDDMLPDSLEARPQPQIFVAQEQGRSPAMPRSS